MEIIKNISIIFMSIFFESLPFLLLGSLISAIIETYIKDETIVKILPKNKFLGSIVGVFLGFFLPACVWKSRRQRRISSYGHKNNKFKRNRC